MSQNPSLDARATNIAFSQVQSGELVVHVTPGDAGLQTFEELNTTTSTGLASSMLWTRWKSESLDESLYKTLAVFAGEVVAALPPSSGKQVPFTKSTPEGISVQVSCHPLQLTACSSGEFPDGQNS
jgi:hypothetical protein